MVGPGIQVEVCRMVKSNWTATFTIHLSRLGALVAVTLGVVTEAGRPVGLAQSD
jgi:hypothetical protein